MKNFFALFIFFFLLFFPSTGVLHAATVSLEVPETIHPRSFPVSIEVDTGGVLINSFDITVSYPSNLVSFKGYNEEGSIKKLWLLPPTNTAGTIHLSGIIPGGVDGVYDPDKKELQPVPIIQLLFSPTTEGHGEFIITHSDILENNGMGTHLMHVQKNAFITILPDAVIGPSPGENTLTDQDPPEPFTIQFIEQSLFSRTPPMIIFSTTDKGSGVEKYQLYTTSNTWKDVTSPLPVEKGILKKEIRIQAQDFAGNTREAEIRIPGLLTEGQLWLIVLIGCICYFIYFVVKRKR